MLQSSTEQITEELNSCVRVSYSTSEVEQIQWPKDQSVFTFRAQNCITSASELQKRIFARFNESECSSRPITFRVFNIKWMFYGGKNFMSLAELFSG